MKIIQLILFSFCIMNAFTQDSWIKGFRPFHDPYNDWIWDTYRAEDVIELIDGNYLISATYEYGIADFYYEHYGMLLKCDPLGNLIWTVKDSVSYLPEAVNVFTVESQEGYIFSYCEDQFSNGSFLNKRESSGELIWNLPITGKKYQSAYISDDNHLILGGKKFTSYPFGNLFIEKIALDTQSIWEYEFEYVSNSGRVNSISECENGDFIFCGYFDYGQSYVYRVSSTGDSLWVQEFSNEYTNVPACVLELSNGNILVSGYRYLTVGEGDGYISLFDSNGSHIDTIDFPATYKIYDMIEELPGIIVFNSALFGKYNLETNEIIFLNDLESEDFSNPIIGTGDNNIIKLEEGYIISGYHHFLPEGNYLLLMKVNSNGDITEYNESLLPDICNIDIRFQNPFSDNVTFSFNDKSKDTFNDEISIYNIKGQKIKTLRLINNKVEWDSRKISSGIYFLKMKNNNIVKKMLKLKN